MSGKIKTVKIKKSHVESEIEGIYEKLDHPSDLYIRATDTEDIFSERSLDQLIVEEPTSKEECEDLVDKYNLWDVVERCKLVSKPAFKPSEPNRAWGIEYQGINATTDYVPNLQDFAPYIYIFKGEYLGENLHGDGDIIKPKEILYKLKIKENS